MAHSSYCRSFSDDGCITISDPASLDSSRVDTSIPVAFGVVWFMVVFDIFYPGNGYASGKTSLRSRQTSVPFAGTTAARGVLPGSIYDQTDLVD